MKMQRLFSTLAVTGLFLPLSATASVAGPGRGMGFTGMGFNSLNLSAEQQQQIQEIRDRAYADSETQRQQLWDNRDQMRSLQWSDANADQLRQQRQNNQELSRALGDLRFETQLQIREVLTPEQRSQIAQRAGRGRGGRGGGGRGNQGDCPYQ
jgi:protein CpxP